MELKEIEQFNDWWTSGTVRSSLLMPYKRQLYNEILNYLEIGKYYSSMASEEWVRPPCFIS